MSKSSNESSGISNKLIDLLVSDVFRRHGIDRGVVNRSLNTDQKQELKDMVEDLKKQVDSFMEEQNKDKKK